MLTPTATSKDPPPGNSSTMHSRMVCKELKLKFRFLETNQIHWNQLHINYNASKKKNGLSSFHGLGPASQNRSLLSVATYKKRKHSPNRQFQIFPPGSVNFTVGSPRGTFSNKCEGPLSVSMLVAIWDLLHQKGFSEKSWWVKFVCAGMLKR